MPCRDNQQREIKPGCQGPRPPPPLMIYDGGGCSRGWYSRGFHTPGGKMRDGTIKCLLLPERQQIHVCVSCDALSLFLGGRTLTTSRLVIWWVDDGWLLDRRLSSVIPMTVLRIRTVEGQIGLQFQMADLSASHPPFPMQTHRIQFIFMPIYSTSTMVMDAYILPPAERV